MKKCKSCQNVIWMCFLLFGFWALSGNLKNIQSSQISLKWHLSGVNMTCPCSWVWMESREKRMETSEVQHIKSSCGLYEFLCSVKGLSPKRRQVGFLLPKCSILFLFFPLQCTMAGFLILNKLDMFSCVKNTEKAGFSCILCRFFCIATFLWRKQKKKNPIR